MAFGTKTNERPGTRAQVRHLRVSAYKAREVLDLIRGLHVDDADGVLDYLDRLLVATIVRLGQKGHILVHRALAPVSQRPVRSGSGSARRPLRAPGRAPRGGA